MQALDYLAIIRTKGGLTQEQISAQSGISQSTISKIEKGAVTNVRLNTYLSLKSMADALAGKRKRKEAA